MENMDKGLTTYTKMGADSLAKNTPNAPEFIFPICLHKPKNSGFQWKKGFFGRPYSMFFHKAFFIF